jgi:hypothetical protein
MADTVAIKKTPAPRRHPFLKVLAIILVLLIVLVVAAYFVGTSSGFIKSVVLPKVGKSLNATITAGDISVSPFKQVVIHDLKVQTTGSEPLLVTPEFRAQYSLMDIIRGSIRVQEVVINSPKITLIQNPDGTSNLDPITNSQKAKSEKSKSEKKSSKPMQLDVRKVSLNDAEFRKVTLYKGGTQDVMDLSHVTVNLENLKNGQTGKLELTANLLLDNHPPLPKTSGLLEGKATGSYTFALSADLKPVSVQGNTHVQVARAEGSLADAATAGADFTVDMTPTEIKQITLAFIRGSEHLGELKVSGPFDAEKQEGQLTVQLTSVDKRLLNLVGAKSGLDFGPTTISSSNHIGLAKAGSEITLAGQFSADKFQVTRTNQTTPPMDLRSDYNLTVDKAKSNAVVNAFNLSARTPQAEVLHGQLTSPMTLGWGGASSAVGDSALEIKITQFNLVEWKPFLEGAASAGVADGTIKLVSQAGGKNLTFNVDTHVNNLTVTVSSNQITDAAVVFQAVGKATDLKQVELTSLKISLARQNEPIVTVDGSGIYNKETSGADLQVTVQAFLAQAIKLAKVSDAKITAGSAELKGHIVQSLSRQGSATNTAVSITGALTLKDLTGSVGKTEFRGFGTVADVDIGKNGSELQLRKVNGKISEGNNAGGSFDLTGNYNTDSKTGKIAMKLADFNQAGLRPFLESALKDKKLVSVSLNGNLDAQMGSQDDSSVKANIQVANLVVSDPKNQIPATPLQAGFALDAGLKNHIAEIHQGKLSLTPTAKGTNQIQITGRMDLTDTNATQGNLKISSDSLDLTSYYDLFAGNNPEAAKAKKGRATASATPASPAPAPGAAPGKGANEEPEAMDLHFHNFTAELAFGHLYLRELEMNNFQATAKIEKSHVILDPCKVGINGAPFVAKVDIDLGVPGYKYNINYTAQAIPMAPIVNTFRPERKGEISGTLTSQAQIQGEGTTGVNLKRTLTGNFDVNTTNMNLSVVNIKSKLLKELVDIIGALPELIKNPSSLVGTITGSGGGGLSDELKKSPINTIVLKGTAGAGKLDLQQAVVTSAAFRADAHGTATLADVLTNSAIQIPVGVALSRGIAERWNLVPANTPTNEAYAKLPDFLTMKGTVGEPKRDINKTALGGALLRGIAGAIPAGTTAGNALQGLSGLLGGSSGSTATPQTQPNASGTTTTPQKRSSTALQNLGGLLGNQPAKTTSATTNGPTQTSQAPVENLINDLFKSRRKK